MKKLLIASLLLSAGISAHAETIGALSAGVQHSDIGGRALNQMVISGQGQTDSMIYGAQFADGNHNGLSARSLSASLGYSLGLKAQGLVVAPTLDVGESRLNDATTHHVALGVNASYTFKNSLTVYGGGFAGRAFGTSGAFDSGTYTSAMVGLAYPVGPGAVSVGYNWNRTPEINGQHLVSSGIGASYSVYF